ncbi:MAG: hypothetical protein AB7V45_01430 [Candidatus Krumholzibacteriia bacterium]
MVWYRGRYSNSREVIMRTLVLLITLFSSASFAQIDPGVDGMGVYFDENATIVSTVSDGVTWVTGYLILTHPSEQGELKYFTVTVETYEDQLAAFTGWPRFGINQYTPMPGANFFVFSVVAGDGEPFFLSNISVLADIAVLPFFNRREIRLYLANPKYSMVGQDGPFITCAQSSGSPDLPVAVIDGPAPVGGSEMTWGSLKSLFH